MGVSEKPLNDPWQHEYHCEQQTGAHTQRRNGDRAEVSGHQDQYRHQRPCRRIGRDGNPQRDTRDGRHDTKVFHDQHEDGNGGDAERHTYEQPHMQRVVVWSDQSVCEGKSRSRTDDDRNQHARQELPQW